MCSRLSLSAGDMAHPLLSRGGGTSLTGGCCNVAVVIDWSKHLNHVSGDRPGAEAGPRPAWHRPRYPPHGGRKHGLTFAPDPSTHTHNTLGGMIGNNSCGVHSLMGLGTGRTSDQVHELDILLYDGTRMTVGATSEGELEHIIPAAAGRERSTHGSRTSATDMPMRSAADIPKTCRGGSRDTTLTTCCPRTVSMSPEPLPARKEPA